LQVYNVDLHSMNDNQKPHRFPGSTWLATRPTHR